ncbi:hypothetical protein LINGRAHAP2_LOCUS14271, partial [Linum grandiflorum]
SLHPPPELNLRLLGNPSTPDPFGTRATPDWNMNVKDMENSL